MFQIGFFRVEIGFLIELEVNIVKAAVCREFGQPLLIEEITLSTPEKGDVLVRLKACSICHSDISYADGIWGGELPAVYGHEGAGIVEAVGDDVSGFSVGDHVIVTLIRHCGDCHYCDQSAQVLCEGEFELSGHGPIRSETGEPLHQAMNCGAFAEAVVVHPSQLHKIPEDMPFDVASLLACGVITGYGAVVNASDLSEGQHAVVIGCGGVGLNSIQAAHHKGAKSVIALDLEESKRELAQTFGATHAFDPRSPDVVDEIMGITDGRGADCVFVTVGAKSAIDSAQNFITRNGTVVVVGMPSAETRGDYDPGTLAAWGQKIVGTKMGNTIIAKDIPELLKLYESGEYKLDELISRRFSLEEVNEAMDEVRSGKAIKNVIIFD